MECAKAGGTFRDRRGVANSLNNVGLATRNLGDLGGAEALLERSLVLMRQLDIPTDMAYLLINLGTIAQARGDEERAQALWEEALAVHRSIKNPSGVAYALTNLAAIAAMLGEAGNSVGELRCCCLGVDGRRIQAVSPVGPAAIRKRVAPAHRVQRST